METEANDTYIAGEATFTLTVTGPDALEETPAAEDVKVFYESFDKCNKTGGNDGSWSGSVAGTSWSSSDGDNSDWNMTKGYVAYECVKLGTGSAQGIAQTPQINLESDKTYKLTFRAGAWSGKSTNLKLSMTNGTLSASNVTMKNAAFDDYELTITNASANATISFKGNSSSDSQFFLDEVKITLSADPISSVSVTIPTSGYCSYCSMYPLNLPADNDNCKAYVATSVNGNQVTLKRVRGEIKGGVPLIFIGTPNSYDIPTTEASTTVPYEDSNLLRGTLAPTYVTQSEGDYTNLGLSGSVFKKINSGVVPANKAYLHIPTSMMPASGSGSARMNIFIDDDDDVPTGVKSIENEQLIIDNTVYNLKGQRVEKPVKGQLYIVNGKKVVIK